LSVRQDPLTDPVGALLEKYGLNGDDELRARRRRNRKLREWLRTKGLIIMVVLSLGVVAVVAIVAWSSMAPSLSPSTPGSGQGTKKQPAAPTGPRYK